MLIDTITHVVTYVAVGALFGYLGWFNRKAMHYAYVIISEMIALSLALLMRFVIDCYWIVLIIIGIFLTIAIMLFVLNLRKDKKNTYNKN